MTVTSLLVHTGGHAAPGPVALFFRRLLGALRRDGHGARKPVPESLADSGAGRSGLLKPYTCCTHCNLGPRRPTRLVRPDGEIIIDERNRITVRSSAADYGLYPVTWTPDRPPWDIQTRAMPAYGVDKCEADVDEAERQAAGLLQ